VSLTDKPLSGAGRPRRLGIPGHVTGDAEHSRFVAACTHAHPLHRQGASVTETVTENVPLAPLQR